EAVFPKRFEADLYYRDEFQVLRHIDRHHVLAYDERQAEQMIFDRHWDCRLDSSGCAPHLDFHEVEMDAFHAFVEDPRDPMGVVSEHYIEAHCTEDVLECLKMLYPVEEMEVTIVDSDGNRSRLEDGKFVPDADNPGGVEDVNTGSQGIHVAFSRPRTIRGRTYAVEQVLLRLGGTPVPGENFAAKCDDAHWLSTREDVERWLADRGLSTNEAQNLLLDAIERKERDREKP
ncbi:MAG: hypothetical protein KY475_06545, partial [Planctomycetes bacterium]|nr:hypothetical protein [Planctomycetota bacterium]